MVRWDDGRARDEVYAMWQRNFQDPVAYADFYFEEVYGKNRVLLHDGDVFKGMLHLNPYRLCVRGREIPATYIVGVATDEIYRRQGVMRDLLDKTFHVLRDEGEAFTYLMPADENYYLPFDFRFGMDLLEEELMLADFQGDEEAGDREAWTFTDRAGTEELKGFADLENQAKVRCFDIFTRIDPAYLARLAKEAHADYGYMYYVCKDGDYAGRFVVSMDHGYLILSQIFCLDPGNKETFLRRILAFCKDRFGYIDYQVQLDESWEEILPKLSRVPEKGFRLRCLKPKRDPKIMFRITDLEKLGTLMQSQKDLEGTLYVEDTFFEEMDGPYRVSLSAGRVSFQKMEDLPDDPDFDRISVGDLTEYIFSGRTGETVGGKTKVLLEGLCPLRPACILEIV